MKHPERVITERHVSTKWSLPAMGWIAVYTLAAILFGALAYFTTRTS